MRRKGIRPPTALAAAPSRSKEADRGGREGRGIRGAPDTGPLQRGRVPVGYVRFPPHPHHPGAVLFLPAPQPSQAPLMLGGKGLAGNMYKARGLQTLNGGEDGEGSTKIAAGAGEWLCGRNKKGWEIIREASTAQCRRQRWFLVVESELGNVTPSRIKAGVIFDILLRVIIGVSDLPRRGFPTSHPFVSRLSYTIWCQIM
jgi:hypothetical protein